MKIIPSIKNPADVTISVGEYPSIKTTNRLIQPANVLVIANAIIAGWKLSLYYD